MRRLLSRLVLYRTEEKVDFSFGYFIAFVIIQTVVFITIVLSACRILDRDLFAAQLGVAWWQYLALFGAFHLFHSLFEYVFHRFVLHRVFWKGFAAFRRKHTEHHGLTHVVELKNTANVNGQVAIRNRYAITQQEQIKSSAFPGYALVTFWGVFSIVYIPLQLALSDLPILITGYLAVVFSFAAYEIIHAVEHLDYDKHWRKWVERYPIVRRYYGFHLMHHQNIKVNQAIGGFFGLPIWDWVFRTYHVPKELPLPGARVSPNSLVPPKPRAIIRWLDKLVERTEERYKQERKREVVEYNQ